MSKDVPEIEYPSELDHVWTWFCEVFNPGGVGMGAYRTEYREIQAYADMTHTHITPSEARLIRRFCEVYIEVDSQKKPGAQNKGLPPGAKNVTTMKDTAGIRAIFANAGSTTPRSKAQSKAAKQPTGT